MTHDTQQYTTIVEWTGNPGAGTRGYSGYSRAHRISVPGKPPIEASSDPAFRGDPARYNPEELLVASLSGCHMLWFLHLCAEAEVTVVDYRDSAVGTLRMAGDGGGDFEEVLLRPRVTVGSSVEPEFLLRLHERAHGLCFIARSVRFPVRCEPVPPFGI